MMDKAPFSRLRRGLARALSAMLALCLLTGAAGVGTAEAADEATARFYTHDGRVTLIDGATVDTPVTDFDTAGTVVDSALDRLGGDERTRLEPWRTLSDACGNRYFVFQQMLDGTTVLGGAVKVITDGSGHMLGLTSSIVSDLPEQEASESIGAEEAERIALEHARRTRQQALTLVEGHTDRMILPLALEVDIESEDDEGSRYVWVVYTDNPDSRQPLSSDLPYLAHYVTLAGEYLYSLPTIIPGDEAGTSGFDASYVFEFMESVPYTGFVDLSSGEEMEITVDVMRDKRTGMYYLANLERRIVVADCWEFLYNGNRVVLESSPDNLEWDQTGLLSLYNYCRAYDYYRAIGWSGGDGLDTPILILNNFCDIDHVPVDNAAYAGGYLGWQIFLASQGNDFSQCLDILAHEYTHCVTGSVMTYNAYMNDYGAINEAISDIQGKTCQMMMEGAENVSWVLGDKSAMQVRDMSDPHRFQQPEFTWDIYYMPAVRTPTVLNDQGGVHNNSSLLNVLAWRLYEKGGMTLEEGRSFWFTVDCAMVPGTDYAQLGELLPWALRVAGLEAYGQELQRALDATRLGRAALPEMLDDNRALLTLTLPENAAFDDEQWILYLFSVDVGRLIDTVMGLIGEVSAGNFDGLPGFVQALLNPDANGEEILLTDEDAFQQMREQLIEWAKEKLEGVFYSASTNAGQDGRTMRMVSLPGHAVPVLIHGIYNSATDDIEETNVLACLGGRWIDLNAILLESEATEEGSDVELSDEAKAVIESVVDRIVNFTSIDDVLDVLFFRVEGGAIVELPTEGLDSMEPVVLDILDVESDETEEVPEPRKSRPKTVEPNE